LSFLSAAVDILELTTIHFQPSATFEFTGRLAISLPLC
jgi:hypothetical protein